MNYYKLDHEATKEDLNKFNYPNMEIGVISLIENEEGQLLLQQRGKKSRDVQYLYENIGGSVESFDKNYKEAILREIKEEAGEEIQLETSDSIGIYHYETEGKKWVFVIYKFNYLGGDIKIIEKDKCLGYKFMSKEEAMTSDQVSEGCRELIKNVLAN